MAHVPTIRLQVRLQTGDSDNYESQETPYAVLAAPLGTIIEIRDVYEPIEHVTLTQQQILATKGTLAEGEHWIFDLIATDHMIPPTPWKIVIPGQYTKTVWLSDTEHGGTVVDLADLPSADLPVPRLDTQQLKAGPNALKASNTPSADTIVTVDPDDPTRFKFETHENIGDGLNQTEVDARIKANVKDWAETGSSRTIPDNIIPATITRDTELATNTRNLDRKIAAEQNERQNYAFHNNARIDNIRQVPSTPGTSTGVGHVLTVTGENDEDYHWQRPPDTDTSGLDSRITTNANDIDNLEAEASTLAQSIAGNTRAITANTTAIGQRATTTQLQQAIRELGSSIGDNTDAIADISENEVRVIGISGWDAHDNARTLHIAIYPPKAIGRNQTLRFTVGGVAATASSGDGIDANGGVVMFTVNATNSATITRAAARDGHVEVDWIYGGNTYHGYLDYVPPAAAPAPRSNVLQSAAAGATAGVNSVTLPADYATYKTITLVVEDTTANHPGPWVMPTSYLAAKTAKSFAVELSNFNVASFSWVSSTRVIGTREDSRIAYAELHD